MDSTPNQPNLFHKFCTKKTTGEISFLQQNCNRNKESQYTLLEIGFARQADFILIQEPAVWPQEGGGFYSVSHQAYSLLLPFSQLRPRVAIYYLTRSRLSITPKELPDNDLLLLEISGNFEHFQLLNLYNEKKLKPDSSMDKKGILTTKRSDFQNFSPSSPLLLVGDFNLHHPWWNAQASQRKKTSASHLTKWLEKFHFSLLNEQEVGTFYRANLQKLSIIDLVFHKGFQESTLDSWAVLPGTGRFFF